MCASSFSHRGQKDIFRRLNWNRMEPTSCYFFLSPLPPPLSCRGIAARRRNTSFRVKSISRSKCSRKLRTYTRKETQDRCRNTSFLELCPSLTRLPVQRVHVRRHRNDFSLKRFRSVDSKTRSPRHNFTIYSFIAPLFPFLTRLSTPLSKFVNS